MTHTPFFADKRLVLFDLDGTLLKLRPTDIDAFLAYSAELGLKLDDEARLMVIRWNYEHWAKNRDLIRQDEARLGQEAFMEKHLRLFLKSTGIGDKTSEAFAPQIAARFQNDYAPQPTLAPGTERLLHSLREAGLGLGLVSNRNDPVTDVASALGIDEAFDFTLAGGEVGSWKPDPAIFRHALKMGGDVPPETAVYVGDNYYADVLGAQGAGMAAVLVDENGAFPEAQDECLVVSSLSDLTQHVPGGL